MRSAPLLQTLSKRKALTMLPEPNEADLLALENIIDRCGLANTLDGLAKIATSKAEHIRQTYPDDVSTPRQWDRAEARITRIIQPVENLVG
jgi:hypothetical protein